MKTEKDIIIPAFLKREHSITAVKEEAEEFLNHLQSI